LNSIALNIDLLVMSEENKIFIRLFCVVWIILNIVAFFIADPMYPQLFYPFSGYPGYFYSHEKNWYTFLEYSYSLSEFTIYVSIGVLVLYLVNLKK
jgi:hypothetical protein